MDDDDDVLEDYPELWGNPENVTSKTSGRLSKKSQIDAIRRFDNHFRRFHKHYKKTNEHLWWLALSVKIGLFMLILSIIGVILIGA